MEIYETILNLLLLLLSSAGNIYWANYLKEDILDWNINHKVDHHLSAYHKEGIHEYYFTVNNDNIINPCYEVWANGIYNCLCSIAITIAKKYKESLEPNFDYIDILGTISINQKEWMSHVTSATICKECGSINFSANRVEWIIANYFAIDIVKEHFVQHNEKKLLDFEYLINLDFVKNHRNVLVENILKHQYNYSKNWDYFMRPCYYCGSEKTAVKYFNIDINLDLSEK